MTIFGRAVNTAVNLYENAACEQNTVVIDQFLYEKISRRFRVSEIPAGDLGKACNYTALAYEVHGFSDGT